MNEMIERVARAICLAHDENPDMPLCVNLADEATYRWVIYIEDARAAIVAMRDSTPEMNREGLDAICSQGIYCRDNMVTIESTAGRTAWIAMIDAALNKKTAPTD
jgi:hypothetical protein